MLQSIRRRAKQHHELPSVGDLHPGLITVVQRFRSDLGLYTHLHSLATDGAFVDTTAGSRWLAAPPLEQEQLVRILELLHEDLRDILDPCECEELYSEPSLSACVQLSLGGPPPLASLSQPPAPKPLLVSGGGLRLHAATTVDGRDRKQLERLCRYLLRPPFAHDAVQALPNGRVRLHLKRPHNSGASYVDMHPHHPSAPDGA